MVDQNDSYVLTNKKEILELILQFFYENNYIESAKLLESKANIVYHQNKIQQLKLMLSTHKYNEAIEYIEQASLDQKLKNEALVLIKSRIYFKILLSNFTQSKPSELSSTSTVETTATSSSSSSSKPVSSIDYLRTEISQIVSQEKLNQYSTLLFIKNKKELEMQLKNQFEEIINDDKLITKIQSLFCLSLDSTGNQILPNSRLESLLNKYAEIEAQSKKLILVQKILIEKVNDEVWHLEFSKSFKYFATCSRNGIVSVYSLSISKSNNTTRTTISGNTNKDNDTPVNVLITCISSFQANKKYISSLSWSNDEKYILTSSNEKQIRMWNPFEGGGKCLKTFQVHDDFVSSALFFSNDIIVSGGIDKKLNFTSISTGTVSITETFFRIGKILKSEALNSMIIIPASLNDIIIYDYNNVTIIGTIPELDPIISAAISKSDNGRYLISNVSYINANINLYNLQTRELLNKYYGHRQEYYVIDCSFAGENDEYIICGSEDLTIFIWHRNSSIPISEIKGHTGAVNSCSLLCGLNEMKGFLLFSVSDDHTLRVWSDNSKCNVVFDDKTKSKKNEEVVLAQVFEAFIDKNKNNEIDENDEASLSDQFGEGSIESD